MNRFFAARGYRELNANQKTFCEDAYGREQAFRDGGKNRNRMTADEVARLFQEIARGEIAGTAGTEEMLKLLSRDVTPEKPFEDIELEDARVTGHGFPAGVAFLVEVRRRVRRPPPRLPRRAPQRRRLRARGLHEGRQDGSRRHSSRLREGRGKSSAEPHAAVKRDSSPPRLSRCGRSRPPRCICVHVARPSGSTASATASSRRAACRSSSRSGTDGCTCSIQVHRRQGIVTMASQSKDGEIIARWLERNGYVVARGSTSRGGGAGAPRDGARHVAPAAQPR